MMFHYNNCIVDIADGDFVILSKKISLVYFSNYAL
jgi:hypothetical protein